MKFLVAAVDFDGTIAENDVLDPTVRRALTELRGRDITVLLVTGRRLNDLRRVVDNLHFVDAVVAENGAVILFPDSGYERVLGEPPPPALLEDLARKGVSFTAGQSVVEAEAIHSPQILATIQQFGLPLSPVFNRSRVMILPHTVSKKTGLLEALKILRLSSHNTIGIGDAENDHELLQACELGVAVGWGSAALKRAADCVLEGDGPPSVAKYLLSVAELGEIPAPRATRRNLLLGYEDDGRPLALSIRGRNVLVAGDSKSGKSWVIGSLCEQLILYGYSLFILDAEGDYRSLEALPGVMLYGGLDPLPGPHELMEALRHPDVTVIVDLSHTSPEERNDYVRTALQAVSLFRQQTGLPHRIVLDEAHYFLRDAAIAQRLDFEHGGYTLATYRTSQLHPSFLKATEVIVVTRESDPEEIHYLSALCRDCKTTLTEQQWKELLGDLPIGNAVALPLTSETNGRLAKVRLAPRLTPHVRHLGKYLDIPVPESSAFVFWRDGTASECRARTLQEFVTAIEHWTENSLRGHIRRHDFSRWIAHAIGDYPLSKEIESLEDAYIFGETTDFARLICGMIRSRYKFVDPRKNVKTAVAATSQPL